MKAHIPSESLSAYLDDAVENVERQEIERHLSRCVQCKNEVEQFARMRELLRPRANYPVPPFFASRLAATLKEMRRQSPITDFVWVAKRLMPGFVIFLAALWLWASSRTAEVSSRTDEYFSATDSTTVMALLAENERDLTTEDVLQLAVYEPSDSE